MPKKSLANLDTLISSIENSIGNAPSSNEGGRMKKINNDTSKGRMVPSWLVLVEESGKGKTTAGGRKQETGK